MHPILKRRSRLLLYLAVWVVFGLLLTVVFIFGGRAPPLWSLEFAVPMAMLLGLQSLSFWYLVQSMPPGETPVVRMAVTWLVAGLVSLLALARHRLRLGACGCCRRARPTATRPRACSPLLIFAGAIGISLAVLGHYLAGAFQRSRDAERTRARVAGAGARSGAEVAARAARSALPVQQPEFGRGADRQRHRRRAPDVFPDGAVLPQEPDARRASRRFRSPRKCRWRRRSSRSRRCASASGCARSFDITDDVRDVAVPPLVLQPLVENAVHHGVAHLLEGGEVCVQARRREGFLELVVENPCDPDRPPLARHRRGPGERALARRDSVRSSRQRRRRRHRRQLPCFDPAAVASQLRVLR